MDHGILIRTGVNFSPDKQLRNAIAYAHSVFKKNNKLFVITSLKDREHSPASLHYYGLAFDCRTRHITDSGLLERIYADLVRGLEPRYNVILENTHIHIEVNYESTDNL